MKEWKLSIFNIMDKRIKFHSRKTNLLPPKPKSSFRHLKQGIQEFHRKYVLVPEDKAGNNVVVVGRLHYINTLKQELLVINPIKVNGYATLFNCTPVDRVSDSMMAPT